MPIPFEKLKPCPNCNKGEIEIHFRSFIGYYGLCSNCYFSRSFDVWSYEEFIHEWNKYYLEYKGGVPE